MNYKYVSVKQVITRVLSNLNTQEENIRISDMIEWAGESLLKIGGFPTLLIRTTGREDLPILESLNYQAELPFDFHSLIQVSYSTSATGPFYPMRYATGSFEHNSPATVTTSTDAEDIASTSNIVTLCMQLYSLTYAQALAKINTEPSTRSILNGLLLSSNTNSTSDTATSDYIYTIRGGYIKTNQETGFIMMSYQAIPTDLEGYPLIPDNESFLEAIYWYINMKLTYPEWKLGRVRDEVYYDTRRSWNFYCKQAYGNMMMPDRGQMESIKNSWNRLVPNLDDFDTHFSNIGQQEMVYNHATS
jgi:hypothetical protein